MKCEIEYSLTTGRVILFAPFSSVELSPQQISAGKLTAILELIAMAEAQPSAVERAVVNHDLRAALAELAAKWTEGSSWKESGCGQMRVRRFKENGKAQAPTLEELGL